MLSRIAVIIPVFNRRQMVADALVSIANQTFPPSRVIVVDDGSTDGSAQAVRAWSNRRPLPCEVGLFISRTAEYRPPAIKGWLPRKIAPLLHFWIRMMSGPRISCNELRACSRPILVVLGYLRLCVCRIRS
jgi:glycosyltransferase involved in cell wall biosynthesis